MIPKPLMLLPFLHKIAASEDLSTPEAYSAMQSILNGDATTPQISAFLMGLRMKGETSDELLGFARAMREKTVRIDACVAPEPLLDTCGAGGGAGSTFNISTIAAFVVAGAGARVAKHGNRSFSSHCGSADILEELGVEISQPPERVAQAIREVGIGFLFAPHLHPAMKHAQSARVELKMRTVFNLLGPLTNPAGATRQLIGAPSAHSAELMANALAGLSPERAFVVHGEGLDEITTTGSTLVFEVTGSHVRSFDWTPATFGVERADIAQLRGGDRARNAEIARRVLAGDPGPHRDVVLVNSAAALMVCGLARDPLEAVQLAAASIDSGAAWNKLQKLAEFNRG
ncbi:MAG TPA: anthranilate phosphoribosyltransferase [Bryobacteraceae bacterium]|nr:anthranilate phosphoribosyltransferase [Bryobacteraceae bacterium]